LNLYKQATSKALNMNHIKRTFDLKVILETKKEEEHPKKNL